MTMDHERSNLGARADIIFAGAMLVSFVVAYFHYPEIKGRTAAELDEMFAKGLPARDFRQHVCTYVPGYMEVEDIEKIGSEEIEMTKQ